VPHGSHGCGHGSHFGAQGSQESSQHDEHPDTKLKPAIVPMTASMLSALKAFFIAVPFKKKNALENLSLPERLLPAPPFHGRRTVYGRPPLV
jgi:hypothetical protein